MFRFRFCVSVSVSHFVLSCLISLRFRPGWGARYCDERVCLSACVFVCQRAYFRDCMTSLHQIFVLNAFGRGSVSRSSSGGVAMRYDFRFYGLPHIGT